MTDRQYYQTTRPTATTSLLQKLRDHAPVSAQLIGLATLFISGLTLTATVLALIVFAPLILVSSPIWVPAGFLIFVAVTALLGITVAAGSWIYARDNEERLMEIERPGFDEIVSPVSTSLNLRMFVGTWNVGGKTPPEDLDLNDWINTKTPADIYVFGFQEIVPLNAGNVLGPDHYGPAAKWLSLIRHSLNGDSIIPASKQQPRMSSFDSSLHDEFFEDNLSSSSHSCSSDEDSPTPTKHNGTSQQKYCLVASKQMVGLFLCVWVREDLNQYISRLKVSCVGRGIMRYLGNKGSISISMTLHQTTFCFVCTHLASGEKERDENRRNLDVAEILKRTKFSHSKRNPRRPIPPPYSIMDHDNIIWLGDLNYRLASICGDTYKILERNDWESLIEKDQLRMEQKEGRVFQGWEEGDIYFAPTYKYISNSDDYVFQTCSPKEKCQTPAWCDRILWKGQGLKQLSYFVGESRLSDHRPVYSIFAVTDSKENRPIGESHNRHSDTWRCVSGHSYPSLNVGVFIHSAYCRLAEKLIKVLAGHG